MSRDGAMASAYSNDLRDRVIGAVEGGTSRRETGKRFEIGMSTTTRSVVGWDVTATERMRS
jgi:transposase